MDITRTSIQLGDKVFFLENGETHRPNITTKSGSSYHWIEIQPGNIDIWCPTKETAEKLAAALNECLDITLGESHARKTDEPIVSDIPF